MFCRPSQTTTGQCMRTHDYKKLAAMELLDIIEDLSNLASERISQVSRTDTMVSKRVTFINNLIKFTAKLLAWVKAPRQNNFKQMEQSVRALMDATPFTDLELDDLKINELIIDKILAFWKVGIEQ